MKKSMKIGEINFKGFGMGAGRNFFEKKVSPLKIVLR